MAARVGAVFVDAAMNVASFASDLSKAQNSLNTWASSSNKVLAGVVNGWRGLGKELTNFTQSTFTLRNAFVTLAGGGALGLLINRNLEAASVLADTAGALGTTTDLLQEYTFAARQSGVSTEQLYGAIQIFATSLGQAEAGGGKLYTFLEKTNPALLRQVLAAKDVDGALNALFSTMGNLTNQQDRLALAAAAFGKANVNLVNLVEDGTAALDGMRQAAHDLGIVVEADLLTSAKEAGDKIDILSQVFNAKLITAVAANAEEIGNFVDALTRALPHMAAFATNILDTVTHMLDWRKTLLMAQQDLVKIGAAAQLAGMAVTSIFRGGATDADIAAFAAKADAEIKAIDEKIKNLGKSMGTVGKDAVTELDKALGSGKKTPKGIEGYAEQMREQAKATEKASEAYKKLETQGKAMTKALFTPDEKYADAVDELNQMVNAGAISWETYGRGIEKAKAELARAKNEGTLFASLMDKAIDGNIRSWRDLGSAVIDFGRVLLKNLASGQGFNGAGGGSLGSMIGGAGGLLTSIFSDSGGGSGGGMLGSIGGFLTSFFHSGGIVGSSGGMSRNVHPGIFAGAPRFHNGGLVGDEVPIIAKKGERVLTEQQQKSMGSGGNTYYIDARGADSGVEERLRNMMDGLSRSIEPRAVAAVTNARNRNPDLLR